MRHFLQRKSAPRVHDGSVRRKSNWTISPRYQRPPGSDVVIYRERPGKGYRHVLLKRDVERFLTLLPDWNELSMGLQAIVLATGHPYHLGLHRPGIVEVCAWERELPQWWETCFFLDHREVLDRLGVDYEPTNREGESGYLCHFMESSARGFLLMHILLHELGHHHDRMTTASQRDCGRGEPYAEQYALRYADQLWDDYFCVFGW
jgi:hypothetical protein